MNTKNNQRSLETRGRIKKALLDTLERKDILDITVSEVCQTAGINRSTFYSHYDGIGEITEELEMEIAANLFKRFNPETYDANHPFSMDNLTFVLEHIREKQLFYRAYLVQSTSQRQVDWAFSQLLEQVVRPIMRKIHVEDSATEYYFTFFKSGLIAVILRWLQNDCQEDPEVMVSYFKNMLAHPTFDVKQ